MAGAGVVACLEPAEIDAHSDLDPDPQALGAVLPDLIVNSERLAASIEIRYQFFPSTHCAVIEGCVSGPGYRKLVRFATVTPNIGAADLVLGDPTGNSMFEYSTCHEHHHLTGYAKYALMGADKVTVVVPGRKQAFCLRDSGTYISAAGPSSGYTCENQGLTAGWQDVYPNTLDCQWLDVTDVPPGNYHLQLEVNPVHASGRLLTESRYDNNVASVQVTIPPPRWPHAERLIGHDDFVRERP